MFPLTQYQLRCYGCNQVDFVARVQVTESLNWLVRMAGDLETNAVSVERILEYSRLTPEVRIFYFLLLAQGMSFNTTTTNNNYYYSDNNTRSVNAVLLLLILTTTITTVLQ